MNEVVQADPANQEARALAADAFEQMGYAAESATWRNAYLLGARELRNGPPAASPFTINSDLLHAMPIDQLFDVLGTRLNAPRAQAVRIVVNCRFTDTQQRLASALEDGALTYVVGKEAKDADVSVTLTRTALESLLLGRQTLTQALPVNSRAPRIARLHISVNEQTSRHLPGIESLIAPTALEQDPRFKIDADRFWRRSRTEPCPGTPRSPKPPFPSL